MGGEAFAVDASIIVADAHRRRGVAKIEDLDPMSNRAVAEYLVRAPGSSALLLVSPAARARVVGVTV